MRYALIILALTATAVGRIHIGRQTLRQRAQAERHRLEAIPLNRALDRRKVELARLLAPHEVRRRIDVMALDLTDGVEAVERLATCDDER